MDIQQIVSLIFVAAAAAFLGLRLWRQARGKSGGSCGGCGECGRPAPAGQRPAPQATPLVSLDNAGGRPSRFKPPTPDR